MSADDDVPPGVDFHDPAQARQWVEHTAQKRPWRPAFFEAFAEAIAKLPDGQRRVLELGSGPGQLARAILEFRRVAYVALDFAAPMHALAREHLGPLADRVTFETRDFREPAWAQGLGTFDAVVTMQAAHETRHKRHLGPFLERARAVLAPSGVLLYCDHYFVPGSSANPALCVTREEQPPALRAAGFTDVRLVRDEGGMALYEARG